jgi:hypothetical protein
LVLPSGAYGPCRAQPVPEWSGRDVFVKFDKFGLFIAFWGFGARFGKRFSGEKDSLPLAELGYQI